jgi:predicted Zn-dependent protease
VALLLALALVVAPSGHAAEAPQLAEKTSQDLEKLKPLTDAKDWDAALALLDTIQASVSPTSYDLAIISGIKANIYMQKSEYGKALEPMETAVRLSDAYGYLDEREVAEKVYYLVQLYYQEAVATKSPALQQQYFNKCSAYIKRWIESSVGKSAPDAQRQEAALLYASILYNQATIIPDKIDMPLLKKARAVIEDGLLASTRPKEAFYILLLATYQQEGDYAKAADILELLVKQYPGKKDYWAQLLPTYLNLALDKDEDKAREYNIRAIITTERAQALGFAKNPKDNFNLVGLYSNLGQFGKATELLYAGLKNGSIDSTQGNWQLLASSYQQVDKPYQAIDVLKEAAQQFPHSGQLDFQIAQIYYSLDKPEDAFRSLNASIAKGHLDKPGAVYNYLAYIAFELRRYDDALVAVDKAISYSQASDTQLLRLKQAIQEALKEQEQLKAGTRTQ